MLSVLLDGARLCHSAIVNSAFWGGCVCGSSVGVHDRGPRPVGCALCRVDLCSATPTVARFSSGLSLSPGRCLVWLCVGMAIRKKN